MVLALAVLVGAALFAAGAAASTGQGTRTESGIDIGALGYQLALIALGAFLGIGSSLGAWLLTTRVIRPKIVFSSGLSKVRHEDSPSGFGYRFRIRNPGRRGVIDLELRATLRVKALNSAFPSNIQLIDVPIGRHSIPRLPPKGLEIRGLRVADITDARILRNPELSAAISGRTVTLEQLLNLGDHASLLITALGYDEFSGARRYFESPAYSSPSIVLGRFNTNSLEIAVGYDPGASATQSPAEPTAP